ncbi:MAG: carboxypeptidase regulatory-like domain-containing protein [Candidatus Cloacimonadales bacterium]|nr:carboxypeptidase regulatory-like domain-containing protein [Candidatus Cloacimonadales bacterium]
MKRTLLLFTLILLATHVLFAGSITGTVSGNPVNGLMVHAFEPGNPQSNYAAPVENGAYTISDMDLSTYIVKLSGMGIHIFYDGVFCIEDATPVELTETTPDVAGIDFVVVGGGLGTAEINGTVTDDAGLPLADIMVELIAQYGMPWFQFNAATDEFGYYTISDIPAGEYYLTVMAENYLPYFYDGVINMEDATLIVLEDEAVVTIDPVLQPLVLYQVTGTVLDDEGNPIEDCLIAAMPDGNGGGMWNILSSTTLADGTFELNIPEGDYFFAAHLFDWMNMQVQYYDHKDNWQEADIVAVNAPVSGIDFDFMVVSYNSLVSGTITDVDNLPVEGANTFLYPIDPNQWFFAHSFSDEFGFYEMDNIPPGDYYLSVNAQYYQPYFYDGVTNWEDATIITIAEDDVIIIDPVLEPIVMHTVSGTVLDDQGNPMSNVIVFAHSNNWNPGNPGGYGNPGNPGGNGCNGGLGMLSTQPDANGYFELSVPEGEYIFGAETLDFINTQIQFYDHKPSPDVADVVLVEDDVTGIDFDFAAPAVYDNSISGVITLAGIPVENSMVVCISVDETFSTATFTNEFGQYELDNLPENDYYILAYGEGGVPTFYPGVICFEDAETVTALGIVTGIDFELVPINGSGYLSLNGFVSDDQNQPLSNSTISITDPEGNVVATAQTNNNGFYEMTTVIAGDVEVAATKIFYSTSSTSTTMVGNTSINFILEPTSPAGSNDTPVIEDVLSARNYPNPFNPSTTISFNIPKAADVTITIYNVKGQQVTRLLDEQLEEGIHSVVWNGLDSSKKTVSSGIYYYKVKADGKSVTNKMVLMK